MKTRHVWAGVFGKSTWVRFGPRDEDWEEGHLRTGVVDGLSEYERRKYLRKWRVG